MEVEDLSHCLRSALLHFLTLGPNLPIPGFTLRRKMDRVLGISQSGLQIFSDRYFSDCELVCLGDACRSPLAKWAGWISGAGLIALALMFGMPLWDGSVMPSSHRIAQDVRDRYAEALTWIGRNPDERLYLFPQQSGMYLRYQWGYLGMDFTSHLLHLPTGGIVAGTAQAELWTKMLNEALYRQSNERVLERLAMTGDTGWLNRTDLDWAWYARHLLMNPPQKMRALAALPGAGETTPLGSWSVTTLEPDIRQPLWMASTSLTWVQGPQNVMMDLLNLNVALRDQIWMLEESAPLDVKKADVAAITHQAVVKIPAISSSTIVKNSGWIVDPKESPEGRIFTGQRIRTNGEITYRVRAPVSGTYEMLIYAQVGREHGAVEVRVDDRVLASKISTDQVPAKPFDARYLSAGNVQLTQGKHTVTLKSLAPNGGDAVVIIRSLFFLAHGKTPASASAVAFQRKTPTRLMVDVPESLNGQWLSFAEPYHRGWRLRTEKGSGSTRRTFR